MSSPGYILSFLIACCFTLATWLQPRAVHWNSTRAKSDDLLTITLGDARRLFANHFFIKADVYFHSGNYPSIFDQAAKREIHIAEEAGGHHDEDEDEEAAAFAHHAHDWIQKFGENFINTGHSHLTGTNAAEILPWMRIAAELDPQQVETYTVAAYFLRTQVKQPVQAERFLREGLRANPGSYEILYVLGEIYFEDYKEPDHARNIWELAVRRWHQRNDNLEEPDANALHDVATQLANLEEREGNFAKAIEWKEVAKPYSPTPERIQSQIDELRHKLVRTPE